MTFLARTRLLAAIALMSLIVATPGFGQSRSGAFRGGRASPPSRIVSVAPPVPGLGFDYPHLAAVGRSTQTLSRANNFVAPVAPIVPIFDVALPYYYGYGMAAPLQ